MADWFDENDPAKQDWFEANSPSPTPAELSTLEAPEGSPQRQDINRGVAGNIFAPPGVFARDPTLAELINSSMPRSVQESQREERRIPLAPPLPEQGAFEQGGVLGVLSPNVLEPAEHVVNTLTPHSAWDVASFLTPAAGAVKGLIDSPETLRKDLANIKAQRRGDPLPFPEQLGPIHAAEQTPAWSQERKNTGAEIVAQMLMAKTIAHGLARPEPSHLRTEPLVPEPPPTVSKGPGTIAGDVSRALEPRVPELAVDVDPGVTQSLAQQILARRTLTPEVVRAFAERGEPLPLEVAPEPTGPVAETAVEKAMRTTSPSPLRAATELEAPSFELPDIPGVTRPPVVEQPVVPPEPAVSPRAAKELSQLKAHKTKVQKINGQVHPDVEKRIAALEERVQHGQFAKPGYTAVDTPPEAPVQAPGGPQGASKAPGGVPVAETPRFMADPTTGSVEMHVEGFQPSVTDYPEGRTSLAEKGVAGKLYLEHPRNFESDYRPPPDFMIVEDSVIAKSLERQGYGTQLYNEALKLAQSQGYKGIASHTADRNLVSDSFWKKNRQGNKRGYDIITERIRTEPDVVPTVPSGQTVEPYTQEAPPIASEAPGGVPVAELGTVRLYHGSSAEAPQAGRDFTTDRQYAADYAAKAQGGGEGKVWYVDVPEGVVKTHDEYGQPMTRVVVPDEIANRAQPLTDEPYTQEAAAQREAQQQAAPQAFSEEPHVSAIANRFTAERAATGELGEIKPGESVNTMDLVHHGLKMPPEKVNESISRIMQGGDVPINDAAAIRGEEARLSQRSGDLSRAARANPSPEAQLAADNAFKDLTDFHNGPVAQAKRNWHHQGKLMQGEIPVDLSTLNGMREAWLKDTGKPPPAHVEPKLQKAADKLAKAIDEERAAARNGGDAIEKATRARKLPTAEEVRNNIAERMKVEPCII